jgi:hypothetical protein
MGALPRFELDFGRAWCSPFLSVLLRIPLPPPGILDGS